MRRFILNIGWARAGSTAFRRNFLQSHPDLVVAHAGQPPHEGPGADVLRFLKTAPEPTFQQCYPVVQHCWRDYVATSTRLVCLSDEELSIGLPGHADPLTVARRSALLFPEAEILAVVRPHLEAIASFYGLTQRAEFGRPMPFSDWLDEHLVEASDLGVHHLFTYADTLDGYGKGRPRDSVIVVDHRDLRERPGMTYRRIAARLGVSTGACASLSTATLNASPGGPPDWPPAYRRAVERLYETDRERLRVGYGISL